MTETMQALTDVIQRPQFAEILEQIDISNTQCIRVGLVDMNPEKPRETINIGIQKFWRKGNEEWNEGKGFYVSIETAQKITDGITNAIYILKN